MLILILRAANGRFVGASESLVDDRSYAIEHATLTRARSAARRAVAKHGVTVNIFSGYGGAAETLVDVILTPNPVQANDAEVAAPRYKAESRPGVRAGILIRGARDVFMVLDNIKAELKEHFVVIQLDTRGRIMANRVVAIGSLTGVEVHPREVFKDAVIASAAAIVIAHNHPSGNTSPSPQDIQLTARLREAGDIMGIPVVDHVIVSTEGFTSLAERGWK